MARLEAELAAQVTAADARLAEMQDSFMAKMHDMRRVHKQQLATAAVSTAAASAATAAAPPAVGSSGSASEGGAQVGDGELLRDPGDVAIADRRNVP